MYILTFVPYTKFKCHLLNRKSLVICMYDVEAS